MMCRGAVVAFVAVATLLPGAAIGAEPVGHITEFSRGVQTAQPIGIAPGPDGNVWFADARGALGRTTPAGRTSEFHAGLNPGSEPWAIALGSDGSLWFTDLGTTKAIGRITPGGQIMEFSDGLNAGSRPDQIAPGSDGSMWFTDGGTTRAIGRVTPQGQVTEYSSGLDAGSLPVGIAPGPDGNLWFTDVGTTRAIGRITPQGQITEYASGLNRGSYPNQIAAGPDGNLWFTDRGTTRAIGRITPQAQITEYSSGLRGRYPGSDPLSIAPGSDGALWFTDTGAIGRITPQGTISEFSRGLNGGATPRGIAPGPDGKLWFTDNAYAVSEFVSAIGRVHLGAPASLQAPPTVSGQALMGRPEICRNDRWASWAGVAPLTTLFSFDGYRWLRDGTVISNRRTTSFVPSRADAGHRLACVVTTTYPVPLLVSVSATSTVITVQPAVLSSLRIVPRRAAVGGSMRISYALTFPASRTRVRFTVERERTLRGVLVRSGRAGRNSFTFNGRIGGRALEPGVYRVTVTPVANGLAGRSRSIGFRIVR